MNIFVTGGTGFIGSRLVQYLIERCHVVKLYVRPFEKVRHVPDSTEVITGDPTEPGDWSQAVASCDGAVNLAGTPIFGLWTSKRKEEIRASRIQTTRNLVDAIPPDSGFRLVSASAVGIYGDRGEELLIETVPLGEDFLATVARQWEKEAMKGAAMGCSVATTRFGVVLGRGEEVAARWSSLRR